METAVYGGVQAVGEWGGGAAASSEGPAAVEAETGPNEVTALLVAELRYQWLFTYMSSIEKYLNGEFFGFANNGLRFCWCCCTVTFQSCRFFRCLAAIL